jgi:hypothetical protein
LRLLLPALATAALLGVPAPLEAQVGGRYRLMVGANINSLNPWDADVGTDTGPGLLLRGVPRRGWGPVIDYSRFELDLRRGPGEPRLGALLLRAPIGGIGYTFERKRLAMTLHAAVGWGFNRASTEPEVVARDGARFEAKDRLLFRGGVTFTQSVGTRFALVGSAGALLHDPKITLRTETGTWRTNGLVWEVGAAYKVF